MGNIWSSSSFIQVAKLQGSNTSSPKKIPQGEIGRYCSTSGTNTWLLGTSFISLLENGWPQPTEYGDGFIVLQKTTSIESRKGKYNITFLHQIVDEQCQQQSISFVWEEDIPPDFKTGLPTFVVSFSNNNIDKLNKGDPLAKGTRSLTDFWSFLETRGGMQMWEGINEAQPTKRDLTWVVEGMKLNTLVWITDGSYC